MIKSRAEIDELDYDMKQGQWAPVTTIFTDNVDEYDVPLYNASEYKPEKHELELAKQQREAEELKIELMVNRFFKTGSFV